MQRGSSIIGKLSGKPKMHDEHGNRKWIHAAIALTENSVVYQARYMGFTEVSEPRGIDVVKDAIKKIQIQHELKKSEAGRKGSKLQKVEIWISVDVVKVVHAKSKEMITHKPLHRISYCADDQVDKKVFAFIAKEQQTSTHHCFVFQTERDAAELTVSVGQAFELAYKRYLAKGKKVSKENKEVLDLKKQIETAKAENEQLKRRLEVQETQPEQQNNNNLLTSNSAHAMSHKAPMQQEEEPPLLVDWGVPQDPPTQSISPFDDYISSLAVSRGLDGSETLENLPERGPFQSPLQKTAENPFNTFFERNERSVEPITRSEDRPTLEYSMSNQMFSSKGGAVQGLPPPPSKQSIKAANASKLKGIKTATAENSQYSANGINGKTQADPFAGNSFSPQLRKDESLSSLEQSLAAGLQFDSFSPY